ncbi:uncharacterized protein LOC141809078 [Halichoeres trimaculatus]|uniref:uncharacterized protein LOC141809078 n=1 Tax=Halichoeres trimaculatus TaxID=147232 RepID=UPI003D9F622F
MEEMSAFQSQLSSIMEKLVVSAVTEINQLMLEYCAVLRVQLSGEKPDNSQPRLHGSSTDITQHGNVDAGTQLDAEQRKDEGVTEEQEERASGLVDCKIERTSVTCEAPPEVQPTLRVAPPAHSATCPQPEEFCPHPAGQRSQFCSELSEESKDPHTDYDPSVEMQCRLSLSPRGTQFPELEFRIKREVESPDIQTQDEDLNLSFELQQGILGQSYTDCGEFPLDSTLPDTETPSCFSTVQPTENHHKQETLNMSESSSSRQHAADRLTSCHQFGRIKPIQYRTPQRFTCDFCGKVFPYLSTMKGHRLSHTRERSHVCRHCGKSFIRRSHLNRHEMLHVGVKQFTCQVCGCSFPRRALLSSHMRIHSM